MSFDLILQNLESGKISAEQAKAQMVAEIDGLQFVADNLNTFEKGYNKCLFEIIEKFDHEESLIAGLTIGKRYTILETLRNTITGEYAGVLHGINLFKNLSENDLNYLNCTVHGYEDCYPFGIADYKEATT